MFTNQRATFEKTAETSLYSMVRLNSFFNKWMVRASALWNGGNGVMHLPVQFYIQSNDPQVEACMHGCVSVCVCARACLCVFVCA